LAPVNFAKNFQLGRFSATILIVLLLAIALCVYFLKYIPEQRTVFNRSAFLELNQIEGALKERNNAYRQAISNYFVQNQEVDRKSVKKNNPFGEFFQIGQRHVNHKELTFSENKLLPTIFLQDSMTDEWEMVFPLQLKGESNELILSNNLDTLLSRLIVTYKDIFDNYLLIRDDRFGSRDSLSSEPSRTSKSDLGEIIFNSGKVAVNYNIDIDSLLKNTDGLSIPNATNINVEGNVYKLFLFPFELGNERVILSGLISLDRYKAAYQGIPFSLISFAGILILLLLIHLPIIRIYMLGGYERVRDMDIRLIIGSYFVAAFIGFFLFAKIFLDQDQDLENQKHLRFLANQIQTNFVDEIESICAQLKEFDAKFDSLTNRGSKLLQALGSKANADINFSSDSSQLDSVFRGRIYPYGDNIFWIDRSGTWTARWAFKKIFNKAPLINVSDREYYKQFKGSENLHIRAGSGAGISFAIQPTLSKLDGEYVISVVIPSQVHADRLAGSAVDAHEEPPWLIGMGAQMHSVYRVIMPEGYCFSIVNQKGDVLYDSKSGRALLSNISEETSTPGDLLQTGFYRNDRYFRHISLRGKSVALLTTPMKGFPYEILVYHNLSNNDNFQEHLIGLSAFITGCIIWLLILAALVNEWSKRKAFMFHSLEQRFDWLCPASYKARYYRHLTRFMGFFLLLYISIWLLIDWYLPKLEFLLFFISLLFPFFIAVHYFLLREEYYRWMKKDKTKVGVYSYFLTDLQIFLLVIVLLINCFAFLEGYSWARFWPLLLVQFIFVGCISISILIFRNRGPQTVNLQIAYKALMRRYVMVILLGICLISIVPAMGIFWLTFKQECNLETNSEMLAMAGATQDRRLELNHRLVKYKMNTNDTFDLENLADLKMKYGIYAVADTALIPDENTDRWLYRGVSSEYTRIHQVFFPQDSTALAWTDPPNLAADSSWQFLAPFHSGRGPARLVFGNLQDGINKESIKISSDQTEAWNATQLMMNKIWQAGGLTIIMYFGSILLSLVLAYRITLSLAKKIFLVELFVSQSWVDKKDNWANQTLHQTLDPRVKEILAYQYGKCVATSTNTNVLLKNIPANNYFLSLKDIGKYENNFSNELSERRILWTSRSLFVLYSKIWAGLSNREKFILYDFAIDGFANHKTAFILRDLLDKGVLFFADRRLSLVAPSFRQFILDQKGDQAVSTLMKKAEAEDSWGHFKTPLLVVMAAIGMFIFITQDAVYQKITGLFASISSLLPLLPSLFSKQSGKQNGGNGSS
jgi:hypothetical protein